MNWVGGIRRRVLAKEEERHRQEQYFANQATAARHYPRPSQGKSDPVRGSSGGSVNERHPVRSAPAWSRQGVQRRQNEEIVCKQIRRGSSYSFYASRKPYNIANSHCLPNTDSEDKKDSAHENSGESSANNRGRRPSKLRPIQPSSLHGPFSKFLLKLEMQGVEEKLKHQETQHFCRRSRRQAGGRGGGEVEVEQEDNLKDRTPLHRDKKKDEKRETAKDNNIESNILRHKENITERENSRYKRINKYRKNKDSEIDRRDSDEKVNESPSSKRRDRNKQRIDETFDQICRRRLDSIGKEGSLIFRKNFAHHSLKSVKNTSRLCEERLNTSRRIKDEGLKTEMSRGSLSHVKSGFSNSEGNQGGVREDISNQDSRSLKREQQKHGKIMRKRTDQGEDRSTSSDVTATLEGVEPCFTNSNSSASKFDSSATVNIKIDVEEEKKKSNTLKPRGRNVDKKTDEQRNLKRKDQVRRSREEEAGSGGPSKPWMFGRNPVSGPLAGAPRLRQIRTLSPKHHRGEHVKIWSPLTLQKPSLRTKTQTAGETKILDKLQRENTTRHENISDAYPDYEGKCKIRKNLNRHRESETSKKSTAENQSNTEWETKCLTMLLGSDFKQAQTVMASPGTYDSNADRLTRHEIDIREESQAKNCINNSHQTIQTVSPEVTVMEDCASKQDTQIAGKVEYKLNKKGKITQHASAVLKATESHIGNNKELFRDETSEKMHLTQVKSNIKSELGKRKLDLASSNSYTLEEENSRSIYQTPVKKTKAKCTSLTRTIYQIDDMFSSTLLDKTPYVDQFYNTPGNASVSFVTPSSFSSSKTPTDPTHERSLEDQLEGGSEVGVEQRSVAATASNNSFSCSHTVKFDKVSSHTIEFDKERSHTVEFDKECSHTVEFDKDPQTEDGMNISESTPQISFKYSCTEGTGSFVNEQRSHFQLFSPHYNSEQECNVSTLHDRPRSSQSQLQFGRSLVAMDYRDEKFNLCMKKASQVCRYESGYDDCASRNIARDGRCNMVNYDPHLPLSGRENVFTCDNDVHATQATRRTPSQSMAKWKPALGTDKSVTPQNFGVEQNYSHRGGSGVDLSYYTTPEAQVSVDTSLTCIFGNQRQEVQFSVRNHSHTSGHELGNRFQTSDQIPSDNTKELPLTTNCPEETSQYFSCIAAKQSTGEAENIHIPFSTVDHPSYTHKSGIVSQEYPKQAQKNLVCETSSQYFEKGYRNSSGIRQILESSRHFVQRADFATDKGDNTFQSTKTLSGVNNNWMKLEDDRKHSRRTKTFPESQVHHIQYHALQEDNNSNIGTHKHAAIRDNMKKHGLVTYLNSVPIINSKSTELSSMYKLNYCSQHGNQVFVNYDWNNEEDVNIVASQSGNKNDRELETAPDGENFMRMNPADHRASREYLQDVALEDTRLTFSKAMEVRRNSYPGSNSVNTVQEVVSNNKTESGRKVPSTVTPDVAAQQFREVMGLEYDTEPSEGSWTSTPAATSQLSTSL